MTPAAPWTRPPQPWYPGGMSEPPARDPRACYYTVVGRDPSFRPLTPGDRSDLGPLPAVRPCPAPASRTVDNDGGGPLPVCDAHAELAEDCHAMHRSAEPRPREPRPKPGPAAGPPSAAG